MPVLIFGLIGSAVSSGVSAKIAAENRNWQERMSNTAHQREMTDLRAAGLNPILASKYSGASTPTPPMPKINIDGSGVVNTALQLRNMKATVRKAEAEAGIAENTEKITGKKAPVAGLYGDAADYLTNMLREIGPGFLDDMKQRFGRRPSDGNIQPRQRPQGEAGADWENVDKIEKFLKGLLD